MAKGRDVTELYLRTVCLRKYSESSNGFISVAVMNNMRLCWRNRLVSGASNTMP